MDFTLTERNIVLFAHVFAAILFLGPVTIAASAFPRFVLAKETGVAQYLHRITRQYGAGTIVVPALGLYLAIRMDYLSMLWVNLSLGLMLIALFILFLVVIPGQQKLVEAMTAEGFDPVRKDVSTIRMTTGIFSLVWVIILYLMVAKPT